MAKKRTTKPKITKKQLTFRIDEALADVQQFAKTPEGASFGIYPATHGVTFGTPLDEHEHFGEGLPKLELRDEVGRWHLDLDIRVSFDHSSQTTYLEIARKGSGTFHSIDFSTGIDYWQVQKAVGRFNNIHELFLINYGCLSLMQNLLWEQSADDQMRKEALDGTVKSFELFFTPMLKRSRYKETKKVKNGALTITTLERIEGGRNRQSDEAIEREKKEFIAGVFSALDRIEEEGGKKTLLDVGVILFEGNGENLDEQSRMKRRLKKFGLRLGDLKREYSKAKRGA